MTMYNPAARLLWSSTASGFGTTLTGSAETGDINLRDATDVWLVAVVDEVPSGTNPTLDVELQLRDSAGHYLGGLVKVPQLTGAGASQISAGLHANPSLVLPERGRLAITLGGVTPEFTGVTVSLYGR